MTGIITPSNGLRFGRSPYAGTRSGQARLHDPDALANALYPSSHGDTLFRVINFDDIAAAGGLAAVMGGFVEAKDAGATSWAYAAIEGGALRGVTGNTINDGISLRGPIIFKGDLNAGFQVKFKADDVAPISVEMGFLNAAPTDATTTAVSDIDTPAFQTAPAEAAMIHIDTLETLNTFALVTKSATYTTNYKKTFFTPHEDQASTTGVGLTAASWMTARMQLEGDAVRGMLFGPTGKLLAESIIAPAAAGTLTGGIEGGTLLAPWFSVVTLSAESKTLDIGKIMWWQDEF